MLSRLLLLVALAHGVLFAQGISAPDAPVEPKKKREISKAVVSMPSADSGILTLPTTQKPYEQQIDSLDPVTGVIRFRAYDTSNNRYLNQTTEYKNNQFEEAVALSESEEQVIKKIIKIRSQQLQDRSNGAVKKFYDEVDAYKKQLKEEGKNTSKKFLSLSRFAVACLTLDNQVIDIERSMKYKQIVLQPKYTMNLSDTVDGAGSGDGAGFKSAKTKIEEYVHKFSIKTFFFVLEWQTENNDTIQKIKMFLMTIFLPLTVGYAGLTKLTKKLQKLNDYDDWGERGIILAGIFILFFSPSQMYKGLNNDKYQQTIYQKWAVTTVGEAVDFADKLTIGTVTSYSQWQMNNLGAFSDEQLLGVYTSQKKMLNAQKLYSKLYEQECTSKYDMGSIAEMASFMKNTDYTFFTDAEFATTKMLTEQKKESFPFGNRNELYEDDDETPILSLTACSQIERSLRTMERDTEEFNKFESKLKNFNGETLEEDVSLVLNTTKDGMQQSKQLGFLYVPYILLQDYTIRTAVSDSSPLSEVNKQNKFSDFEDDKFKNAVLEYFKENEITSAGASVTDYITTKMMLALKLLPYQIVPSYHVVQESVYEPLDIGANAIPQIIAGFDVGSPLRAVAKIGAYGTSHGIAYKVTKSMLEFAPAFLMIVAGVWVVVFYLISLFIYYFVSPYILAYALGAQQTDVLRSFIARGVVLAFKPILLVLSIVITLVALDLTSELLYFTEDVILQNFISSNNISGFQYLLFTFFQGLFHVIALVVTAIMAFVLVFKGADMILAIFGFKDSGVSVQEVVGGDIENKAGKYQSLT